MKKYTLETLKKENELFDIYYVLDESDVAMHGELRKICKHG